MSNWDTPPGGDFARYVEELSQKMPQHVAHEEMTAPGAVTPSRPRAPAPAPTPSAAPAPRPGSIGAKNAAAVEKAQRAAAARNKDRQGAPADPPFVSNATTPGIPGVPQPADVWKALRPPVFAFIALEIAAAFVPEIGPFTTPALFFFIAWAVMRFIKMVGGSAGWEKAKAQIAEEMRKQQRNK